MPNGGFVNEVELQILRLVFKWKVLSFSIIRLSLRNGENENTFKQRVNRLVRKGFLRRIKYLGKLTLLSLTDFGFLRMKNGLDGFKEEGFASEAVWHDFLSVALQLGPLAACKVNNFETVSEQQIRRFFLKDLPYWIPNIDSHRPDGFTRLKQNGKFKIIAYEVEISVKTSDRYDAVCQYYARSNQINHVVWLVKNQSHLNLIQNSILRFDETGLSKHSFILLNDFIENFWLAKAYTGQQSSGSFVDLMYFLGISEISTVYSACTETAVSDFLKELARGRNY